MNKPLEQRIYDGDRAREVLDNPAFADAFAVIRQEYTDAWKNSPARDAEGREELWKYLKLMDKLEVTIRGVLEDGKLASIQLEHQQRMLAMQRSEGVVIR